MKNESLFLSSVLLLACMTGVAETNVVVGNNEWRLSPECRIDGDIYRHKPLLYPGRRLDG